LVEALLCWSFRAETLRVREEAAALAVFWRCV
jgi:hypothetical protein